MHTVQPGIMRNQGGYTQCECRLRYNVGNCDGVVTLFECARSGQLPASSSLALRCKAWNLKTAPPLHARSWEVTGKRDCASIAPWLRSQATTVLSTRPRLRCWRTLAGTGFVCMLHTPACTECDCLTTRWCATLETQANYSMASPMQVRYSVHAQSPRVCHAWCSLACTYVTPGMCLVRG